MGGELDPRYTSIAVAKRTKLPAIPEIVEDRGWAGFRDLEFGYCRR
jgi:hypothetical protein